MDTSLRETFEHLGSTDDKIRLEALQTVLRITEDKVDWTYEVLDALVDKLSSENSYQRSIGIMVLCNLAKSDDEARIEAVLGKLLAHTRDEKFITSRQCLQNIWKVAAANPRARETILDHLVKQFEGCKEDKHYNLIRQDILQAMGCLYEHDRDQTLLVRAQELVQQEKEEKYRKKYVAGLKEWGRG